MDFVVPLLVRRACALALLTLPVLAAYPMPGAAAQEDVPTRWIVGLDAIPDDVSRGDTWRGWPIVHVDPVLRFLVIEADAPTLQPQEDDVRYLEPDVPVTVDLTPNDPSFSSQYGPQKINAPKTWDRTLGTDQRTLCIIDTGIRTTHEDLKGERWVGGTDIADDDNDITDPHGHGTHVTGIAAASIDNGKGIAGIARVPFKHVKVMETGSGNIWSSYVASAMRWCADNDTDIISMSLGSYGTDQANRDAAAYAYGNGLMLFASSGNDGCNNCVKYPAALPEVIAVGCTTSSDGRCWFSSGGPQLELVAPGYQILASCRNTDSSYCFLSGTSMSAPTAAGAAALLWSTFPFLTNGEMREVLQLSARDLGTEGHDVGYGYGRVDTELAYDLILTEPKWELAHLSRFDTGSAPGWTLTGLWHVTDLCGPGASPPDYLGFHFTDDCSVDPTPFFDPGTCCDDIDRRSGSATFGVDLVGQRKAFLAFEHRTDRTSTARMWLDVSTDGGSTWTNLQTWASDETTRTWTPQNFSLDPYVGTDIRLRFTFDTIQGYDNDGQGWHLDDVAVFAANKFTPVARAGPDLAATDHDGTLDESIRLDGTGSVDPFDSGTIQSYEWLINETVIATGATPLVALGVGQHTIVLRVTDDHNLTATDDLVVDVFSNPLPTAVAGADIVRSDPDGNGTETIALADAGSSDVGGTIVAWAWSWNGTVFATTPQAEIVLPIGTHAIALTVTDNGGGNATDALAVTVLPNIPPTAAAATPAPATDGDADGNGTVHLDGSGSTDADGTLTTWEWSVNGTVRAVGPSADLTLPIGTHEVVLQVRDDGNATDEAVVTATIGPNVPPIADAGPDRRVGDAGGDGTETVTLDASASRDDDGTITSYAWYHDGLLISEGLTHDLTLALGVHEFLLVVSDNGGASDNTTLRINVTENAPPVAVFSVSCGGTLCTFDATGSTDPEDALSSYAWTFGDGATAQGPGATTLHQYAAPGEYEACLTVTDDAAATDTVCTIVVTQTLLFLDRFDDGTTGWTLSGQWHLDSRCATPPTGPSYLGYHRTDACSMYTGTSHAGEARRTIDLTGSTAPALSVLHRWDTYSCCGYHDQYIQIRTTGTSSWTTLWHVDASTPDRHDWHQVQLDISAWGGKKVDIRFYFTTGTYTTANSVPGWHIDGIQVAATSADLEAFEWDPVAKIIGPTSAADIDGDDAEAFAFDGTTSSDPDGTIVGHAWTIDGTAAGTSPWLNTTLGVGTHTIGLTVTDDSGRTAVATLGATVAPNQAPVAVAGPDQLAYDADGDGNGTFEVDGSASFDPDGTALTYTWWRDGAEVANGTRVNVTVPLGLHALALNVTDIAGASHMDALVLDLQPNRPPVAVAGPDVTRSDTDGDGSETITLDAGTSGDPDGPVTLSWALDGAPVATGPTPAIAVPLGVHTVTLTVTDQAGATATDDLAVDILANVAPVAVAPADVQKNDDDRTGAETIRFDGRASTDADGGIVAYEWYAAGVLLTTGADVLYDVPVGLHEVTLLVRDAANATSTASFQVTITDNRAPGAVMSASCTDVLCTFDGRASGDADGDPLTHTWSFGDGKTGSGAQGTHAYPQAGYYTACLTVQDAHGYTGTDCETLHLIDVQFEEGFDSGFAHGWVMDGLWHIDSRCGSASSAPNYLGYHQSLLCNYQTTGQTTGTAAFQVDLTEATEALLKFRTRWEVERTDGAVTRDFMKVQVTRESTGATYTAKMWHSGSGNRLGWTDETIDLSQHAGHPLLIRFNFDSATVLNNHYAGWYLDDVRVVGDGHRPNRSPVPAFDADCAGAGCVFDGSASRDERYVVAWDWAFGDGTTATGETVEHVYAASGTYLVRLTVTDNSGATSSLSRSVTVEIPEPLPPEAGFAYDCADEACTFDASSSYDPDGDILQWAWTFGDGTNGTGVTTAHTYPGPGNYTVELRVTDDQGLEDTETRVVVIGYPSPPVASFFSSCAETACTLDGTASYDADGSVIEWAWDLGDGNTTTGARITHEYAAPGDFTVRLTVTDDDGLQNATTQLVQPRLDPPIEGPPSVPPEDPDVPDRQTDIVGDRVPIPWMDIRSAWFASDAGALYVGLKVADIPATDALTSSVAYRVDFVPTWTPADPTYGGRITPTDRVLSFQARALLSPVGSPVSPFMEFGLYATVQDSVTMQQREVHFGAVDASLSTETDILWWPLPRALLQAGPGSTLTEPGAIASPSVRGVLNLYGQTGDSTGIGRDHTF